MKERSSGKRVWERGASTLELLIAFAVLFLTLSAVILVVFGNQSLLVDQENSGEALTLAEFRLEEALALARTDFVSVVSTSSISTSTIAYTQTLVVSDLTQCKKQATSTVSWINEGRPLSISLTTFFSDLAGAEALGGDCVIDPPEEEGWKAPDNFNSADFNPSGISATGLDVENKVVFMSAAGAASSQPDFFVFDASGASTTTPPVLATKLDTGTGLNAVDAIDGKDGYYYIFAANDDTSYLPLKQLVILRVPKDLSSAPTTVASSTLPGVSGTCAASCPQGRSIYYFAPYVYVGTHRTGGKEFHIFDVSTPSSPVWKGSIELNTNVNDIMVKNQLVGGVSKRIAYLAIAGNSKDLELLDVTNPAAITVYTSINVGGIQDAQVLYALGTNVYIGKDRDASGPDFFVVDVSNVSSPVVKGSANIPMKSNTSIRGLRVVGSLAFLGTTDSTDPFQVWKITNPAAMTRWDTSTYNFSEKMMDLDYEDDRIYTANQSNDALRIIYGP
jgi:hypothetical protein